MIPTALQFDCVPDGLLLRVHAKPKASRSGLLGVHDGRLKVAVTAAPDKGRANAALLETVAAALGLKRSQVSLSCGETTPLKTLLITGVTRDELSERLVAALADG